VRGEENCRRIQKLREKAARCRALAGAQANVLAVSELLALAFDMIRVRKNSGGDSIGELGRPR